MSSGALALTHAGRPRCKSYKGFERSAESNPFTPSFGASPPLLVGRDEQIDALEEALDDGVGSPARASLFTGARGSGKTVLLNAVEDEARRRGWWVVSESVRSGLVLALTRSTLPELLREHDPEAVTSHPTQASASIHGTGGGLSRQHIERHSPEPALRSQLTRLCDLADQRGVGVLLTLDEVHRSELDDLRELAQVVQHAFREGRQLAFAAAGLSSAVEDLLNDDVLTFLRRADRSVLGPVADADVARALRDPIETAGMAIDDDALDEAVAGARGCPFLVQLVGFSTWKAARGAERIDVGHAREGVSRAVRRVGGLVHAPALAHLSGVDRSYLAAMASSPGPSGTGAVAQALGVGASYAGQYRLRLIAAGLIEPAGYGKVDFALPYLRDHLREHVATQAVSPPHE